MFIGALIELFLGFATLLRGLFHGELVWVLVGGLLLLSGLGDAQAAAEG